MLGIGQVCAADWPDGLALVHEAISATEEADLLELLAQLAWQPSQCGRDKVDFGPKVGRARTASLLLRLSFFESTLRFRKSAGLRRARRAHIEKENGLKTIGGTRFLRSGLHGKFRCEMQKQQFAFR